jgi:hypothetical protein
MDRNPPPVSRRCPVCRRWFSRQNIEGHVARHHDRTLDDRGLPRQAT